MKREVRAKTRRCLRFGLAWVFSLALVTTMMPAGAISAFGDESPGVTPAAEDTTADTAATTTANENSDPVESAQPEAPEAQPKASEPSKPASTQSSAPAQKPSSSDRDAKSTPSSTPAAAPANASYTEKSDLGAAVVQNAAAANARAAASALDALDGIDAAKASKIANELFSTPARSGMRLMDDEAEIPRSGDGSNIESISAKWITEDTVDNGDASLLYIKPKDDATQSVRLQINYALSGEHDYEPGDITITVPMHIFAKRGGATYGTLVLPYAEDPSMKGDFNYRIIGDTYVLTNTKAMSAATKGYMQFSIDGLTPHELVDMQESIPFDAYIEVVTHLGNTIALRSNELTAVFDTEARITDARKTVYGSPKRVSASAIPAAQRMPGEEEYIKVDWYSWIETKANTVYTIDASDLIDQTKVVNAKTGEVESDFAGFVINANAADGTQLDKRLSNGTYRNGSSTYYYYSTAYPASQFEPDTDYVFHNHIDYTVTEIDPAVDDDPQLVTKESADATATFSFTDPKWIDPTGHFMVVKNGNDNATQNGKRTNNYTHARAYGSSSYPDIHRWSTNPSSGWYGIYPSALNALLDEHAANGEDGSLGISYTIDSVGYLMPWMFDSSSFTTDGEVASRLSRNYSRPITMTTTDSGISIGRDGAKLAVGTDYTYASVEFPQDPWLYTGTPKNINPDGSWAARYAKDGTFEYKRDNDKANWPDIKLEALVDGSWQDLGTASWKSGSFSFTPAGGSA